MADMGVFEGFFQAITGHQPYLYQVRLAGSAWPRGIESPTGTGKTAAVVLAWLWKRLNGSMPGDHTPRRLVYALPMRSLTEQVYGDVTEWLEKAESLMSRPMPRCYLLEGGEDEAPWYETPEAEAILVGTVDMLLSRALWRGYGQSRYMWPVSAGLLNNDTLWVFDEVQMLGSALETSAQLEGLRSRLGTAVPTRSLWMSAIPCWDRLETVDHDALRPNELFTLTQEELQELAPLLTASKTVCHAAPADKTWLGDVAAKAVDTFTKASGPLLVIVNTVERARLLHREISRVAAAQGTQLAACE